MCARRSKKFDIAVSGGARQRLARSGRRSTTSSGPRTTSSTRRDRSAGTTSAKASTRAPSARSASCSPRRARRTCRIRSTTRRVRVFRAAVGYRERRIARDLSRFARAANFASPGSFARDAMKSYTMPEIAHAQSVGARRLAGRWATEHARLTRSPGRIVFRFKARDLHLVLGPGEARQAGALPRDARWQGARRRTRAWTSTRTATAPCASSGCISSSARRARCSEHEFAIEFLDPRRRGLFIHVRLRQTQWKRTEILTPHVPARAAGRAVA